MVSESENKKKVLIIDDDPDVRRLLSLYMKARGLAAITAANGLDAIGLMEQHRVAGIISEWTLPMIDGERFLNWLRTEAKADTPVLILTAHESKGARERMMAAGANGVLFKPAGASDIFSALEPLIRGA